jgi:hypothetical protein
MGELGALEWPQDDDTAAWRVGCAMWKQVFASMPLDVSSSPQHTNPLSQIAMLIASTTPALRTKAGYELTKEYRHSIAQAITTFRPPYALLHEANGQIEDYAVTTCRSPRSFAHIISPFTALNLNRALLKIIGTISIYTADLGIWYETCICPVGSGAAKACQPVDVPPIRLVSAQRKQRQPKQNPQQECLPCSFDLRGRGDRAQCCFSWLAIVNNRQQASRISAERSHDAVDECSRATLLDSDNGRTGREETAKGSLNTRFRAPLCIFQEIQ